ncbi:MAG: class II glutamine amidotransferase [Planctomycetes bacterium]|nr:class II glutamine amidotransferase [Planctomycetota bacterium]
MSDDIKHECGVAIVRLKQPLAYYRERHGTPLWGLKKLYLLMEKQRNRGQDGAGLGVLKQHSAPGSQYFHRQREAGPNSLDRLWRHVHDDLARLVRDLKIGSADETALMRHYPWLGELYLGHLRYGTHGGNSTEVCHPYVRASNWRSRYLSVAGNFNLTNTEEIFGMLVKMGQHPIGSADTSTVMEKIGHFLDVANEALVRKHAGKLDGDELAKRIGDELDLARVLRKAARAWDGGYFMIGAVGHGAAFALRDPNGIRPGYWYEDDEVVAVASERTALVTCFNVRNDQVREVTPGAALVINHQPVEGRWASEVEILPQAERRSCTFERIYFSRGNDADIYRERKALGRELVPALLKAIDFDLARAVISYIPNTAESAYYGLLEGLEAHLAEWKEQEILRHQQAGTLGTDVLRQILAVRPWQEKAALKDAKLRTFISGDDDRGELVSHAYDITRGILRPGEDNLVVIDDSIVRGTTLRQSILRMLSRLEPKRIVVLSSAPQIRYPDCYGIDMSELGRFVAFEAAITLLRDRGQSHIIDEVYRACIAEEAKARPESINHVKRVYEPFTDDELSERIAKLVRPTDLTWDGEVRIVFQTVAGLRWAIPGHTGDWYFTGDYPTPGGYRVANRAFINYVEKRQGRAYEAKA